MERRPRLFTTQYEWAEKIRWRIVPPNESPSAPNPLAGQTAGDNDPRWSRRGFHWGTGLWGWKRWFYAWLVHPRWRKWARRVAGYLRSKP
jgi:hypothetical protein